MQLLRMELVRFGVDSFGLRFVIFYLGVALLASQIE